MTRHDPMQYHTIPYHTIPYHTTPRHATAFHGLTSLQGGPPIAVLRSSSEKESTLHSYSVFCCDWVLTAHFDFSEAPVGV